MLANLAIQKVAEPGAQQCVHSLSQSSRQSSDSKSIESLSEHSAKEIGGEGSGRRHGLNLDLNTAAATSLTEFPGLPHQQSRSHRYVEESKEPLTAADV